MKKRDVVFLAVIIGAFLYVANYQQTMIVHLRGELDLPKPPIGMPTSRPAQVPVAPGVPVTTVGRGDRADDVPSAAPAPAAPRELPPNRISSGRPSRRSDPAGWENLGRATVENAFISLLWAIANGKPEQLAESVVLSEAARTRLDTAFSLLAPEVRAQHGDDPLRYFLGQARYMLIGVADTPARYSLKTQWRQGALTTLRVGLIDHAGGEVIHDLPFTNIRGGWRLGPISEEQYEAILARTYAPVAR